MRDDGRSARTAAGEAAQERARTATLLETGALEARLNEARAKRAEALAARKPSRLAMLAARMGRARPGLAAGAERSEPDLMAPPIRGSAAPRRPAFEREFEAGFAPDRPFEAEPAPSPLPRPAQRARRPEGRGRAGVWISIGAAFAAGAALAYGVTAMLGSDAPERLARPAPQGAPDLAAVPSPAPAEEAAPAPATVPPRSAEAILPPATPPATAIGATALPAGTAPEPAPIAAIPVAAPQPEVPAPPEAVVPSEAPASSESPAASESRAEAPVSSEAPAPARVMAEPEEFLRASGVAAPAAPRPLARPAGHARVEAGDAAVATRARQALADAPAPVTFATEVTAPVPAALPGFGAAATPEFDAEAPRADPGIAVWLPDQPTARARGRHTPPEPVARPAPEPPRNILDAARRDLASGIRRLDNGLAAVARRVERGIGAALDRNGPKTPPP